MTMITRTVSSLCTHSSVLTWALAPHQFGEMFTSCRKIRLGPCASLVPLGMRWACTCVLEMEMCLCSCSCCGVPVLFYVVLLVMCRAVSLRVCCVVACPWLCAGLLSLCCRLCVCCVVKKKQDLTYLTVPNKKTRSEIVQKLPHKEFISTTVYFNPKKYIGIKLRLLRFYLHGLINSKNIRSANKLQWLRFFLIRQTKVCTTSPLQSFPRRWYSQMR